MRNGKYLCMEDNGKVNIDSIPCVWDITLFNTEITLFSNGFYLHLDEGDSEDNKNEEKVIGYKYMSYWDFDIKSELYYFMKKNKKINCNYILSIEERNKIKVRKLEIERNNELFENKELFQLIDFFEDNNNLENKSHISYKIKDDTSSLDIISKS